MDVHQEVLGFGGAVTDSVGINILDLTHEASDNLLGYRECHYKSLQVDRLWGQLRPCVCEMSGFIVLTLTATLIAEMRFYDSIPCSNISTYFGPRGIGYSLIRMPMACTDFSTRFYTYAMVENDTSLDNFTLTEEDYVYKVCSSRQTSTLCAWISRGAVKCSALASPKLTCWIISSKRVPNARAFHQTLVHVNRYR